MAMKAREVLNLARSLHELAPKLLLTLAAGEGLTPSKTNAATDARSP